MYPRTPFLHVMVFPLLMACMALWAKAHDELLAPRAARHLLGHDHHDHDHRACATPVPHWREQVKDQMRRRQAFVDGDGRRRLQSNCQELCTQCIEIEVYLNLIQGNITGLGIVFPHPTSVVLDYLNGEDDSIGLDDFSSLDTILGMFRANMQVVNDAFSNTPFSFRFVEEDTTVTVNNDWSNDAVDYQVEMSQQVGKGDLRKLDVFVAWSLGGTDTGTILGIASLPAAQIAGQGDGLILRYDVLNNGGLSRNDLGYTLVHEIGHWMGLLHTFQNLVSTDSCNANEELYGDFVDDTPVQDGPSTDLSESCTEYLGGVEAPDTCPDLEGRDDIFNYMNYVDNEVCQAAEGRFSCGQIERMYEHWLLFRDHVTVCTDSTTAEIEIVVELDVDYSSDNVITLTNEAGDIFFDSLSDHLVAQIIFDTETLLVDLCLPRDEIYLLVVQDLGGDGFGDGGSIEVYVDRILVEVVKDDFGSLLTVTIDPSDVGQSGNSTMPNLPNVLTVPPNTTTTTAPSEGFAPTDAPSSIPTLAPSETPTSQPFGSPTEKPTKGLVFTNPIGIPPLSTGPPEFSSIQPTNVPNTEREGLEDGVGGSTATASGKHVFVTLVLLVIWTMS